jgi:dihydroxy-acid dehydratase
MMRETRADVINQAGMARARALIKAMGFDDEDLRRPRIGVANTWSETSPGHIHLKSVAEAVKAGIWQAGGTPYEFGGFAQCPVDVGRAGMRWDTPTRDVIAVEVETCAQRSFAALRTRCSAAAWSSCGEASRHPPWSAPRSCRRR